jgi:hypothetical protein
MDKIIEKYLRDNGLEMCTWKKNGQYVVIPKHEKIVHLLFASYIKDSINRSSNPTL